MPLEGVYQDPVSGTGKLVPLQCDSTGRLIVVGVSGGGGGGGATTIADGGDVAEGARADARATWYDSTASVISLIKLWIAAAVGAGSRTYTYTNGQLTSEAWTLFGTTRTKTYTYTSGALTGESDWV